MNAPRKLEGWAVASGSTIVSVVILCTRHAGELRPMLPRLRARLRMVGSTIFRIKHRRFVREFVETSPGCGQCAIDNGTARLWDVVGFNLTRDEMAAEGLDA